jgi:hypothetical protein
MHAVTLRGRFSRRDERGKCARSLRCYSCVVSRNVCAQNRSYRFGKVDSADGYPRCGVLCEDGEGKEGKSKEDEEIHEDEGMVTVRRKDLERGPDTFQAS